MTHPLLRADDLSISFGGHAPPALDRVCFDVHPGETLALVGESGSGKSISALAVMGLLPAAARLAAGRILWQPDPAAPPVDLLTLPPPDRRRLRGRSIGMIFQEPMTALNPVLTVGEQVAEGLREHLGLSRRDARRRAADALAEVGIHDAPDRLDDYPHQFSGGMRQRVMIAAAVACGPSLLIADEPTTALDASLRDQVLDLLADLQRRRRMAILFISHDLPVVRRIAHRVCVMRAGRVMEQGPAPVLFDRPLHPYTRALIECLPSVEHPRDRLPTVADLMDRGARLAGRDAWTGGPRPSELAEIEPGRSARVCAEHAPA